MPYYLKNASKVQFGKEVKQMKAGDIVPDEIVATWRNPELWVTQEAPIGVKVEAKRKEIEPPKPVVNEEKSAGNYKVNYNASSVGRRISSGIYFYKISTSSFSQVKKMVLLK